MDYGSCRKYFKKKNGVFSTNELISKALPNIVIPTKEERDNQNHFIYL